MRDTSSGTGSRGSVPLPDLFTIVANRLAYGPKPGMRAEWNGLGPDDDTRLQAWLDQQIDHTSIADPEYDAAVAAAGYQTLQKTLQQLWQEHRRDPDYLIRRQPIWECEVEAIVRAAYSRKQLLHVMTEFWFDHFSVFGWESNTESVLPDWFNLLRTHCFGNFRDFLGDVSRHTAMLYYLDQYTSSAPFPNENYARELFELHTMGAENYLGVLDPLSVPPDGMGNPIGYVDSDVYEAARCLAGFTFSSSVSQGGDTGLFYYDAGWHDIGSKLVLGSFLNFGANSPEADGNALFDLLANHPGTGRHLARKLCVRLISDDPPQSLIDAAAAEWNAHLASSDQIERVVRLIISSEEFKTTWGEKVKRPYQLLAGAIRATNFQQNWAWDAEDMSTLLYRLDQTSHGMFNWRAPNGYPDQRSKWESTSPRIMTWRFMLWLTDITDDVSGLKRLNAAGETPAGVRTATEIADYWIDRILDRPLSAPDRQEVIEFMAAGYNPNLELDLAEENNEERLRMMVGLILNCPDNLMR
jgi:uncharacterized protein (DUF1800 family)